MYIRSYLTGYEGYEVMKLILRKDVLFLKTMKPIVMIVVRRELVLNNNIHVCLCSKNEISRCSFNQHLIMYSVYTLIIETVYSNNTLNNYFAPITT